MCRWSTPSLPALSEIRTVCMILLPLNFPGCYDCTRTRNNSSTSVDRCASPRPIVYNGEVAVVGSMRYVMRTGAALLVFALLTIALEASERDPASKIAQAKKELEPRPLTLP